MTSFKFIVALIAVWSINQVKSECPNINEIPVLNEEGTEFYCAEAWGEWGDAMPIHGCNGVGGFIMDGYDSTNPPDTYVPMGSIIVKAGCTYYGYEGPDYTGEATLYYGPATFPDACIGNNCPPWGSDPAYAKGYQSFQCRCEQDPIICVPSDRYVDIVTCDNTDSSIDFDCAYKRTVGTTFTESVQNSMGIDVTIAESMSSSFFGFFAITIGISATTGYDWTHISTQAMSEAETIEAKFTCPPHVRCELKGIWGNCDGNDVKTEVFKLYTYDQEGNVISERIETFEPTKEVLYS